MTVFSSCTGEFVDINRPGSKLSPEELKRDNYAVGSFNCDVRVLFLDLSTRYLRIIFLGSLFVNFAQAANMVMRGEGLMKNNS